MGTDTQSKRRAGQEVKAAIWTARHPGSVGVPAAVAASGVELGWTATGGILGGAAVGLAGWYRAHPDTFDRLAAPRVRSAWRRWGHYLGRRWADALRSCELVTSNRKSGEERIPRILRVRAHSPSVETVYVRICKGQHPRHFEGKSEELAEALKAERVAVERVKPLVIALIVQRNEPFTDTIDAPDMPEDTDAVDIGGLYVGDDEYGGDIRLSVAGGKHLFVAGASGAGKNSIPASLLRGLAPAIRDGLVRLWIADPKKLEFAALADVAHRYSDTVSSSDDDVYTCVDLVSEYVETMHARQRELQERRQRKSRPSPETPLDLLILDEVGALLAYGDGAAARELKRQLALIGSQGRATGHTMIGLVQEPTKDTVPVRDLFTVRVCLRVTAASHVDMVLGDGSRERGAVADEIANAADTAGIGYVIRPRTRVPMRFRAAYVDDTELDALVAAIHTGHPANDLALKVVA